MANYVVHELVTEIKRIEDRLNLKALDDARFIVPSTILLTQPLDRFFLKIEAKLIGSVTRTAAEGSGYVTALTVPDGKRYYIHAISLSRTAGDGTITELHVYKDTSVRLKSQNAAGDFKSDFLERPIELDETMELRVFVNAITTDSTWNVVAYYSEEDAF